MALSRSKKTRGNAKDAEVSPVDDANEKSPNVSVETEADSSREETSRGKPVNPAQSVSEVEEAPSPEKGSQAVFFSTDGSEQTEDKGPPPVDEESDERKDSSVEDGKKNHNRHGHRKQRQQNWQNKKRGGGGKGKQQQHNQKQRHKSQRRRRTSLSDPEDRHPLEIGTLLECEALANFDAIDALVEECIGGDGKALEFNSLYSLDLIELKEKATALLPELDFPPAPVREEIFDLIFQNQFEAKIPVKTRGILEGLEEGYGLLLQAKDNYRIKSQSAYVPKAVVKRFGLQTGHFLEGFL
ncbi:MAG: hypothetical protein CMI26_09300, partial [Opitutae bacterium]|nr:hypothetical protein [Opitutae bacterium]